MSFELIAEDMLKRITQRNLIAYLSSPLILTLDLYRLLTTVALQPSLIQLMFDLCFLAGRSRCFAIIGIRFLSTFLESIAIYVFRSP